MDLCWLDISWSVISVKVIYLNQAKVVLMVLFDFRKRILDATGYTLKVRYDYDCRSLKSTKLLKKPSRV